MHIVDESIQDCEPHTTVMASKGSSTEKDDAQEHKDVIKDEKSFVEKKNPRNKSSMKECSTGDEQVSTFKSANTKAKVGNGNKETAFIS